MADPISLGGAQADSGQNKRTKWQPSEARRPSAAGLCAAGASVQATLPVGWHAAGWTRHRLVERVMERGSQLRALEVLVAHVVVEPLLTGLEAVDDGMLPRRRMLARVLRGGLVAAADVAALDPSAQMEPPAVGGREALDAARSAGRDGRVDRVLVRHRFPFA